MFGRLQMPAQPSSPPARCKQKENALNEFRSTSQNAKLQSLSRRGKGSVVKRGKNWKSLKSHNTQNLIPSSAFSCQSEFRKKRQREVLSTSVNWTLSRNPGDRLVREAYPYLLHQRFWDLSFSLWNKWGRWRWEGSNHSISLSHCQGELFLYPQKVSHWAPMN